jgi:hypothetical protein
MLKDEIPKEVLETVPEIEWCCGSLATKSVLLTQVRAIVNRAGALESALRQLDPHHPLITTRVKNDERTIQSSPIKTPTF